ncbi:acyl dehydratase [Jannaschia ovalis]|uniref:Acyl dehydratase n=1 Tax=Jannaschia ovalis TaxID=3038773 RepID=A0ABY8L934_9RHOB|nr:acyl dehydratase [Jannaschia sp. GRR-S6-38]WGH77611.1 acyl dehydratase [Jannaschia sp. GRR-S6-38]
MSQPPVTRVKDALDPARAAAMAATLDRPRPGPHLPPFWHHAHFWEARPPAELGRDGHPRVGLGAIPDMGLPRRMWAGGRLDWHRPLRLGVPAERETRRLRAEAKTGRTGPLALVVLEHRITQEGGLALVERQDLVYREDPDPDAPRPVPPTAGPAPIEEARSFDAVTLFRFSALTFNGHRIHYDEAYAREVEGHAGVIVHGPLLAEGLIDLATRHLGTLAAFEYRATAPAILGERLAFCLDGTRAFVRGADGRTCLEGMAHAA